MARVERVPALVLAVLAAALVVGSPPALAGGAPPPPLPEEEAPAPLAFDEQNATELLPNQSAIGTLTGGAQRVFKVFANRSDASPEVLTVSLGSFSGFNYLGWVEVFDPHQVLIDQRYTRFDGDVNVSQFIVAQTGYHLLVVGCANTFEWTLTVNWTAGAASPGDNDNDLANATVLSAANGTVFSNVTEWDDLYDTYRFDLVTRGTSADALVLNLTSTMLADLDLYVYHLEGGLAVVDSASLSPLGVEFAGYYAAQDGPVYVRVLAYAGSSDYVLSWLLFNTTADANNRPEDARAIAQGLTSNNLSRWDDRDFFRIDAPPNTTVNVSFTTVGWNATTRQPDLQAVLWDASFERVTWSFLFDPNERVDALLVEGGVYYLQVFPSDYSYFLGTRMYFDYTMNASVDPPPQVNGGAWPGTLVEDTPATFDLRMVVPPDPSGELLTFAVTSQTGPVSASVAPGSSVLTVTPALDATGNASISVRASDRWRSVDITLPLLITPVNDPPRLRAGAGTVSFDEDGSGSVDPNVTAFDPERDPFTLVSATAAPPLNATFAGGLVGVAAPPDFHGTLQLVLTLRDSAGAQSSVNVTVVVRPVNDPPSFLRALGPLTIDEDAPASGATFSLAGLASDPDGDTVEYRATGAPGVDVLVIGDTVTLVPALDFSGLVTVTVVASDGTLDVSQAVQVTVAPLNDAPVLQAPPGQPVAREGVAFRLNFTADDVDNALADLRFTFWLDGLLIVNASTDPAFSHSFGYDDAGFHVVRASVSDGARAAAIDVEVFVGQTNRPPVADVLTPPGTTFQAGAVVSLTGRGTDPDGDELTYRWIVDGSLASQSEVATLEGLAPGPHAAVLFVSDGDATAAGEIAFTVLAPSPGVDAALAAAALAIAVVCLAHRRRL